MRSVLQRRRPRPDQGPENTGAIRAPEPAGRPAARIKTVAPGSRACCCSAAPAFQVVLPGTSTEILFCGHHYREHRRQLRARGAATYDRTGWQVDLPV